MRRLSLALLDWWSLIAVAVLFFLGLAAIASIELSRGLAHYVFLQKQVIAAVIGLAIAIFIVSRPASALRAYAKIAYVSAIGMLVAVLFFGKTLNGARGWFVIGFGDLSFFAFQPVEWMKVALILIFAWILSRDIGRSPSTRTLSLCAAALALPVVLLLRQPDLGGAMVLIGIAATMLFFAGVRFRHIFLLGGVCAVGFVIGWFALFEPYQKKRIETFLDPTANPLTTGYNVNQAKIAIGSGGMLGRGFAGGSQSQLQFLPESQSDFVFAVIAEEYGFLGSMLILGAFCLLLYRFLKGAQQSQDRFTGLVLVGGSALYGVQMAIHIGANMAIIPATGIALPFVSYGGSSLLMSCIAFGMFTRLLWEVRTNSANIRPGV